MIIKIMIWIRKLLNLARIYNKIAKKYNGALYNIK